MGRQRILIDNLRTADPRTLEILVQDAVRKPIAQISATTVCDLIALSEVPELPKGLARDLTSFAFRAGQEIADLPDGAPILEFIDELETLEAGQVPQALRGHVGREGARDDREVAARTRITKLIGRWEATPPEIVKLGTVPPKIQRAAAVVPSDDPPAAARRERAAKAPGQRPEPKPRPAVDIDREKWLADAILSRLARYREAGLAEAVLVAGLQAEGRATYPDLAPFEVKRACEALATAGKVRRNVTRWAATMRHWV